MDAALLYLIPALFISAILAVGAAVNSGPKHPRHAAPRHLDEGVPGLPPDVGSMDLDAELALGMTLLAAPVDPEPWLSGPYLQPDWRAQVAAELSPEALEHVHNGSCSDVRCWDGGPGRNADPGAGDAGVVSFPPAPDPDWLAAQMAVTFDWVRAMVPRVTGWRVSV